MNEQRLDADVIVIGSGLAGVSVSWPLVEARQSVLMLDRGNWKKEPSSQHEGSTFMEIRTADPEQWKFFLGDDFFGIAPTLGPSPKLRVPGSRFVFDEFSQRYNIKTENFSVIGSLARGGLSNAWGAGVGTYDESDLRDFPISPAELSKSYAHLARRIGISGDSETSIPSLHRGALELQPPLPMCENATRLFERYRVRAGRCQQHGVTLGRALNAVLTRAHGGREACTLDNMCLWGCRRGAIYNAAFDLAKLRMNPQFRYAPDCFVESIRRVSSAYEVISRNCIDGTIERTRARQVVLAAGTLGSTKLVLEHLQRFDTDVRLLNSPMIAFALWLPRRLGAPYSNEGFGMANLNLQVEWNTPQADTAHGGIFHGEGLLLSDLAQHVPFSRPGAIHILRRLVPSMLLSNCFLSSDYSDNRLRLKWKGSQTEVSIVGGVCSTLDARVHMLRRTFARAFRELGCLLVPGSLRQTRPGEDIHIGGTLPMKTHPGPGQTDRHCEVLGAPGLYVVDGSVFPRLSGKPQAFTIMANADRVGRRLAARDPTTQRF